MKLSLIIPVYNLEQFIHNCLDSITPQLTSDVEVIIVDDGSTDFSLQICDAYASKYHNINVIHKSNGGVTSARKAAAESAIGDYILPIDGDDWLEPQAINSILEIAYKHDPDIICFAYFIAKEKTKEQCLYSYQDGLYCKKQLIQNVLPNLLCSPTGSSFSGSVCLKAIRRDLYTKYQMPVPNDVKIGEDALVALPCVFHANSMYMLNEPLYNYRYNETSATKSRKHGFSWTMPETRTRHLRSMIPASEYGYEDQFNRSLVHMLFNVAESHFQAEGARYFAVRKEIKHWLKHPYYAEAIKKSFAKFGCKEWLAEFALKHELIWLVFLYAKMRTYQN